MARFLLSAYLVMAAFILKGQSFELIGLQQNYRGIIGETIKAPILLRNNTDKPLLLVIRKVYNQIGSSQKNYFCIEQNCLDQRTEDYLVRVEPGQVLKSFQVALEAGLAQGVSSIRYTVFNKSAPSDALEFELNFMVDEKAEKLDIYASDQIILHDVYPNPVRDHAFADYRIFDDQIKAKIVIHNILGNTIEEYSLPFSENKVKIRADNLTSGVYFFTLYIDNDALCTRKFMVKK